MKKTFTFLALLTLLTPAFAENFFIPEWKNFCPISYINIDPNKNYIVPVKRYWALRRQTFESRMEQCQRVPEDKKYSCYAQIRELEGSESENYNKQLRFNTLSNILYQAL